MEIEQFVAQSEGEWRSMRSSHSLAFQQFEEVLSQIKINILSLENKEVSDILQSNPNQKHKAISPFKIDWESESDWERKDSSPIASGSSIQIPIPCSKKDGIMLRSVGYIEPIKAISTYKFLSDGTLQLSTKYEQVIAEERIWFIADHVRCRSSILRAKQSNAVLQTSYASEVRKLKS